LTNTDYDRAAATLSGNTNTLIDNDIRPRWLPDVRIWYRSLTENTMEFKLFDPKNKTQIVASSRNDLFKKANVVIEKNVGSYMQIASPDGQYVAFITDWNLYVQEVATGKEIALTTDGVKDFGYATDNAGWRQSNRPILSWSPDSKKIATFKQDQRHVNDMY